MTRENNNWRSSFGTARLKLLWQDALRFNRSILGERSEKVPMQLADQFLDRNKDDQAQLQWLSLPLLNAWGNMEVQL